MLYWEPLQLQNPVMKRPCDASSDVNVYKPCTDSRSTETAWFTLTQKAHDLTCETGTSELGAKLGTRSFRVMESVHEPLRRDTSKPQKLELRPTSSL
jgi:hypothetical protein